MITEIDINKHNFSKIGKYISNKLHHIHKPVHNKQYSLPSQSKTDRKHRPKPTEDTSTHNLRKKDQIKRDQQDFSPPVGTYRVNYTAVDKYHLQDLETSISTTSTDPPPTFLDKSTKPIKSLHTLKITLMDCLLNIKDSWNSAECQAENKSKAQSEKMQKILMKPGFRSTDFQLSPKIIEVSVSKK